MGVCVVPQANKRQSPSARAPEAMGRNDSIIHETLESPEGFISIRPGSAARIELKGQSLLLNLVTFARLAKTPATHRRNETLRK
jgi:hypothetical protein